MTEPVEKNPFLQGELEESAPRPRGFRYADIIGLLPELPDDFEEQVKEFRKSSGRREEYLKDLFPPEEDEIARVIRKFSNPKEEPL